MTNKMEENEIIKVYFIELIDKINSTVSCFQIGEKNEGSKLMVEIIEDIDLLLNVLINSGVNITENLDIKDLNIKLSEIAEAFTNEDYTLIADILQYEIAPFINKLDEILRLHI